MTTVAFWGAGATASLGFRTTKQQSKFVRHLAPVESSPKLRERVRNALGGAVPDHWCAALCDLLAILGDGQPATKTTTVDNRALAAMKRNAQPSDDLRQRVLRLRALYDWPALTAIIRVCPGSREPACEGRFKINDLLNLLDLHGGSEHGFHAGREFLTPQRIGSAKNALKMLLQTMFFIDWQVCRKNGQLARHFDFAVALTRRMQMQGVALERERFESSKFYLGDLSFVSMNYDPVGLWCQMIANRVMNRDPNVPSVGTPERKLEIFVDQAHFVAGRRVRMGSEVWHSMNEPAVQRLNEAGKCIRIMKFLLPHGCICWRECPNCGKLSNYLGDEWALGSSTLIPFPPLRAFVPDVKPGNANPEEDKIWRRGEVDARECVHCGTLTYAYHTSTLWQSNFKARPPSFVEEIQRDLRVVLKKARHIVLLGYSLPTDDVGYRALLAAHRQENASEAVRCTVVGKLKGYDRWVGPAELGKNGDVQKDTVRAAQDIFGADNVRFHGGGIPEVFCERGVVTDGAVERLLDWTEDS